MLTTCVSVVVQKPPVYVGLVVHQIPYMQTDKILALNSHGEEIIRGVGAMKEMVSVST
jgi:hypothetical protein